jgi:chaperonin GroES
MMIRPLRNHIAVKAVAHLPTDVIALAGAQDEFMRGEVIAAGPGKQLPKGRIRPMPVKIGDTVLFRKRSALAYRQPDIGEDFLLIRDDDVLGMV